MEREKTIPEGEVLNEKLHLLGVCVNEVGEKEGESIGMSSFGDKGKIEVVVAVVARCWSGGGGGCCGCRGGMGLRGCAAGVVAVVTSEVVRRESLSLTLSLLFLEAEVEMVRFLEGFGTVLPSWETAVVVAMVVVDNGLGLLRMTESFDGDLEAVEAPLEAAFVSGTTAASVVAAVVFFVEDGGTVSLDFFDLAVGVTTDLETGEG